MTRYNVGFRLAVSGGAIGAGVRAQGQGIETGGNKAKAGAGGFQKAGQAIGSLRSRMSGGLRGIREYVGGLFSLRNAIFSIAGYLGAKSLYDVLIGKNASLEQSRIGIAALIRANLQLKNAQGQLLGPQESWNQSLLVSGKLMDRFRQMAIESPIGSAKDFRDVFQQILTPSLQAGASLDRIQKLSLKTVTVAKLMGDPLNIAGRDILQLLNGSASLAEISPAVGAAFRTLGMDMATFNKLSKPEKLRLLEEALGRFAQPETIKAYARSWNGLMDTVGEFGDLLSTIFGEPIFGVLREDLQGLVDDLNKNRGELTKLATAYGKQFADGIKNAGLLVRDFTGFMRDNTGVAIGLGIAFVTLAAFINPVGTAITATGAALTYLAVNWSKIKAGLLDGWATFTNRVSMFQTSAPKYMQLGLLRMEKKLFVWGLDVTRQANKIPALKWLLGGNLEGGVQRQLEDKVRSLNTEIRITQQEAELAKTAGNNKGDPRAQYQASRQIAAQQAAEYSQTNQGGSVQVTQYITTQDPVKAGNQAAKGVEQSTVLRGFRGIAIPNPKRGQPLTDQQR